MKRIYLLAALSVLAPGSMRAQTPADTATTALPADTVPGGTALHEATVRAARLVFITKKDTIVYNMDALNPSQSDMLGDVIRKMPGLEVRDGALYYNGRAVNRLMVNGVDFKRGDTSTALSVLPAYIIKEVKAYEGRTDQHRITGIDDGQKEQVVDVILKRRYMGTWTGNAHLGGGTDRRYLLRGFANTFTDRFRVSAYGAGTNTGAYQGNYDGNWNENAAGGSTGNTTYATSGATFMWTNGRGENSRGYFKVDGSADWDYRHHNDYYFQQEEERLDDGTTRHRLTDTRRKNNEKLWNASLYFTWRPTDRAYAAFAPSYTNRLWDDRTRLRRGQWWQSVADRANVALDSLESHGFTDGWPDAGAHYYAPQTSLDDSRQNTYYQDLYATYKLTDSNLRLTYRGQYALRRKRMNTYSLAAYNYFGDNATAGVDPIYNRYEHTTSDYRRTQNFLDLNIPLRFFQTLRLTYGYERTRTTPDTRGYRLDRLSGTWADYRAFAASLGLLPTVADWQTLTRDADITLRSAQTTQKHWAELYLQYKKRLLYTSFQTTARFVDDALDYTRGDNPTQSPRRNDIEYVLSTQVKVDNDSSFSYSLSYQYEITPQSLMNEITVPNTSDPLNISLGAPGLPDMRTHNVNFRATHNFRHNRRLTFDASYRAIINNTTSRSTYDKTSGVTTTTPTVVNGYRRTSEAIKYYVPLDKNQRLTLDLGAQYTFTHTPAYTLTTQGDPTRRTDRNHALYLNARLNYRGAKLQAAATVVSQYDLHLTDIAGSVRNDGWANIYTAYLQYDLPLGIRLNTRTTTIQRLGYASSEIKKWRTLWNLNLERSFLKSKALTLKLECSDILNQRNQQWLVLGASTRQSGYATTVGRFFMAHVIYRFQTSKKDK